MCVHNWLETAVNSRQFAAPANASSCLIRRVAEFAAGLYLRGGEVVERLKTKVSLAWTSSESAWEGTAFARWHRATRAASWVRASWIAFRHGCSGRRSSFL